MNKAKELAQSRIDAGDEGYFENEGKNFYELLVRY